MRARGLHPSPGGLRGLVEYLGPGDVAGKLGLVAAAAIAVAVVAGLVLAHGAGGGAPGGGPVIRAYLGAAAEKAWQELIPLFEEKTGIRVEPVYGSSGFLLAQLERVCGDVYAPASPYYMRLAEERGLVDPGSVRVVAYLYPVILVPRGNPAGVHGLEDLARPGVRVGLGNPETVAVGRYAVEILKRLGLWSRVERNVAVYASNVAQLTSYVAAGAVDAAITWHVNHYWYWYPRRTDVVWIPCRYWRSLGPSYIPIAVTTCSKHPGLAEKFIEFVTRDPDARRILAKYHYGLEKLPGACSGGEG